MRDDKGDLGRCCIWNGRLAAAGSTAGCAVTLLPRRCYEPKWRVVVAGVVRVPAHAWRDAIARRNHG